MRRGVARSLNEFDHQVVLVGELRSQLETLEAEKKAVIAKIEKRQQVLRARLERIELNIGRFYFARGAEFFKAKTKTIVTRSGGRVWSRKSRFVHLHRAEQTVIAEIIASGNWKRFLRIELNLTALKNNPGFAACVHAPIREKEVVIITPAE